jgi:hypothetical protein
MQAFVECFTNLLPPELLAAMCHIKRKKHYGFLKNAIQIYLRAYLSIALSDVLHGLHCSDCLADNKIHLFAIPGFAVYWCN